MVDVIPIEANTFLDSDQFGKLLETAMYDKKLSHIDAICYICKVHNIEVESAADLITPKLRKLIYNEAVSINMVRSKRGRKLAI